MTHNVLVVLLDELRGDGSKRRQRDSLRVNHQLTRLGYRAPRHQVIFEQKIYRSDHLSNIILSLRLLAVTVSGSIIYSASFPTNSQRCLMTHHHTLQSAAILHAHDNSLVIKVSTSFRNCC